MGILWNIESKINPIDPTSTKGVNEFVELQLAEFKRSGYPLSSIMCVFHGILPDLHLYET